MMDIPIVFVEGDAIYDAPGGAVQWRVAESGVLRYRHLSFACPCGCGHFHSIPVRRPDEPDVSPRKNAWQWNGSIDKPTLTPSILCRCCECQWHGYLTDGVFRSVA